MARDAYDYRGRIVTYGETLFLVARAGYRPDQTRRLLVGSDTAYATLTALVIMQALAQAVISPPQSEVVAEQRQRGQEGGAAVGGAEGAGSGNDLPAASSAPLLPLLLVIRLGRAAAMLTWRHPLRRPVVGT